MIHTLLSAIVLVGFVSALIGVEQKDPVTALLLTFGGICLAMLGGTGLAIL